MALDDKTTKIVLDECDLPTHWYHVVPDLPSTPQLRESRATESVGTDDILVQ